MERRLLLLMWYLVAATQEKGHLYNPSSTVLTEVGAQHFGTVLGRDDGSNSRVRKVMDVLLGLSCINLGYSPLLDYRHRHRCVFDSG